jgi:hypothetical protein
MRATAQYVVSLHLAAAVLRLFRDSGASQVEQFAARALVPLTDSSVEVPPDQPSAQESTTSD